MASVVDCRSHKIKKRAMPLPRSRSPTRRPAAEGAAAPRGGVALDPIAAEHPIGEGRVVTRGEKTKGKRGRER